MPCPYFEPQQVAEQPQHATARLPLIEEYDGLCHATRDLLAVTPEIRFERCNHGYSRGLCQRFPAGELRSSIRFTIVREDERTIDLICIEEQDYAPLRWRSVQYFFQSECITPELSDRCIHAQVLAFCRSYQKRFRS